VTFIIIFLLCVFHLGQFYIM